MPQTCTVCRTEQRADVDKALIENEQSLRDIARQFGLSKDALFRHRSEHLPATLIKAQEVKELAQADDLLEQVKALRDRADKLYRVTEGILARAVQANDLRTALAAIQQATNVSREARANLELMAELVGELNRNPQVNILVAPEWLVVRAAITEALQPFPIARVAVAERLLQLEGGRAI